METQHTIPEPATAYIARLVDSRKRAYAQDCLACWQQGQPFATEWPNLKAEYVLDVATKMRRYLKVKPQTAQAEKPAPSPVAEWVETVTSPEPATPVRTFADGSNMERFRSALEAEYAAHWGEPQYRYARNLNTPSDLAYKMVEALASRSAQLKGEGVEAVIKAFGIKKTATAVQAWLLAQTTNPEPAKANPQQTGQPEIIVCPECSQAIRTSEIINGKCPNPACFVGLAAYHAAYRSWSSAHDAYSKAARMAGQPYAGNSWLTRNPEPKPDDFRNGKQPKYPEWEKPHFETREEREARLEAEKWANPTIITRNTGVSRILASVPEQQRLKLEAEIAKINDARKFPDPRTYLRGKAYIGTSRGTIYDQSLVFTETLGGEKWATAYSRQLEVAGIVGWNKKDGAKPGDYIPATPAEARHIQAVAGSTFAEAAG